MKAILYIAHGTRSKKGESEATSFIKRVMSKVSVPIQEICFLELSKPSIAEGFRSCMVKGATEVIAIPVFLLAAGHIRRDIPESLSLIQKEYPQINVKLRNAIGVHGAVLDAISENVKESVPDLSNQDRILIVGRGSSVKDIHDAFAEIENGVQQRLGINNIETCYLAAAQPNFHHSLERLLIKGASRVIVVPYLLFSGYLLSEIIATCKKKGPHIIHIETLSKHKAMEQVVAQIANGE